MSEQKNLLWLQSGGCGGCSMSLLCAEGPDLLSMFEGAGINLLWHPSLSESCDDDFHQLCDDILSGKLSLDILCLEGSVIRGPNGSGAFHRLSGSDKTMLQLIQELANQALHVVAIGSCAAYGGITSAGDNPTDSCGLQYEGKLKRGVLGDNFQSQSKLPVINIAGCPTHPNWVTETLIQLAFNELSTQHLDELGRPRSYADHLVHHACPRNEYYEFKASAVNPSELGCMMEHMGCLGTQAHADCNTRLWNGEGSCLRGGYACINCTSPDFERPSHPFMETPKIAGIPMGLPTDMPKAWFVALASLSKAATPPRLRTNSRSDHICIPPGKSAIEGKQGGKK